MRRGRRLVIQIALLPVLYFASMLSSDLFTGVVAIIILVTWPVTITVAAVMVWLARLDGSIESLTDAADNSVSLALTQTGLAFAASAVLAKYIGIYGSPVGQFALVGLCWAAITLTFPAFSRLTIARKVWGPRILASTPTVEPTESDPREP